MTTKEKYKMFLNSLKSSMVYVKDTEGSYFPPYTFAYDIYRDKYLEDVQFGEVRWK